MARWPVPTTSASGDFGGSVMASPDRRWWLVYLVVGLGGVAAAGPLAVA